MAVQGLSHRFAGVPSSTIAFWVAAFAAAALSLAAALVAITSDNDGAPETSSAARLQQELQARNDRIAFFGLCGPRPHDSPSLRSKQIS